MANTSITRSRIRAGINKYDSMLVGNAKFADTVDVSGGLLSSDSTYYYRTFKSSGSLVVTGGSILADILVVAGGGGSDWTGAGAGGLLGFTAQTLTTGTYAVTVGAGGAFQNNGNNSSFGALTAAVGGGKGGGAVGGDGGSGGGSMGDTTSPYGLTGGHGSRAGTGTSGQGNAGGGGAWYYNNAYGGGGGGGAGAVGGTTTTGNGAAAGNGVSTYSAWGLATGTGQNVSGTVYYAGGGGGAGGNNQGVNAAGGAAGYGGGGVGGGQVTTATNGTANTGGGAGGVGWGTSPASTSGGSGIVIVRYLKSAVLPTQTDFELIGTITLSAAQSSVTFTGLPTDYKHLQLRGVTRSDLAGTVQDVYLRFNGDATAGNYYYHGLYGTGAADGSESSQSPTGARFMQAPGTSGASGLYYIAIADILDAFSTTKNKTMRTISGSADSNNLRTWLVSNAWFSTAAINSITIVTNNGSNFVSGTRFSIYGARG